MLTKKQFCECILNKFYDSEHLLTKEWHNMYAFQSSCAGKAAAFLGLIKDQETLDYLASRGGILYMHLDKDTKVTFLTMDEMLELLPLESVND